MQKLKTCLNSSWIHQERKADTGPRNWQRLRGDAAVTGSKVGVDRIRQAEEHNWHPCPFQSDLPQGKVQQPGAYLQMCAQKIDMQAADLEQLVEEAAEGEPAALCGNGRVLFD